MFSLTIRFDPQQVELMSKFIALGNRTLDFLEKKQQADVDKLVGTLKKEREGLAAVLDENQEGRI